MNSHEIDSPLLDEGSWSYSYLMLMHICILPKLYEEGYQYTFHLIKDVDKNIAEVRIEGDIARLFNACQEEFGSMCSYRRTKKDYEELVLKYPLPRNC